MVALLPQDDHERNKRRDELERQRRKYRFKYTHVEPLALLDELPRADKPSLRWWLAVMKIVYENRKNSLALSAAQATERTLGTSSRAIRPSSSQRSRNVYSRNPE